MFETLIAIIVPIVIAFSAFVPSTETLRIAFDQGQKLYAIEDYAQAAKKFQVIRDAEKSRFLNVDKVNVRIGDSDLPVKVAATFQLANAYREMAAGELAKAEGQQKKEAEKTREEVRAKFKQAADYYEEVAGESISEEIKVLAQYHLVKARFEEKNYDDVINEAEELITKYPKSGYIDEALYEMGWAYYNLGKYDLTIDAFTKLIVHTPEGYRADRAQFQIGKSYFDQKKYPETRIALQKLLDKHDIKKLSEVEKIQMESQKLSGVVKETLVELLAKAQMLIGDSYRTEGDWQNAVKNYELTIANYPKQEDLVEASYQNIADIYFERGDLDSGIGTYKKAINNLDIPDEAFRARMQFRIAEKYLKEKYYSKAIDEERIYIQNYPDVAKLIGFSMDKAQFQIGEAFYKLAEEESGKGNEETAKSPYKSSKDEYLKVIGLYPQSDLKVEALFGAALASQKAGDPEDVKEALKFYEQIASDFQDNEKYASGALFQSARLYYRQGNYEKAISTYETLVGRYPKSEEIDRSYLELGVTYKDYKKEAEALPVLSKVSPKSDVFGNARLLASEILVNQKKYDDAENTLREMVKIAEKPDSVLTEFHYGLARVYLAKKDYKTAANQFTAVIDSSSDEQFVSNSLFGRGSAYFELSNYVGAEQDLTRLLARNPQSSIKSQVYRVLGQTDVKLKKTDKAIQAYKAIIQAPEDNHQKAEFLILLADLYYNAERFNEAIQTARQILNLDFTDSAGESGYFLKERAYFIVGDSFSKQNDYASAIENWQVGLNRYLSSTFAPDMTLGIAVAYFRQQDYKQAISYLKSFVTKYPDNTNLESAEYFLAYSYLNQTSFEDAITSFKILADKFPKSQFAAEARYQEAENYYNLDQYKKALETYQKIIRDYSRSEFADDALYNTGWCYFELKQPDNMVKTFREFVSRFPTSSLAPNAQFSLGDFYYNEKQYDKAEEEYKKVVEKYPSNNLAAQSKELLKEIEEIRAYLKYSEAMSFFDKKSYLAAIKAFDEVIRNFPKSESRVGAMANMAMSYEQIGNWNKAVEIYDRILKEYGKDPRRKDALDFAKEHRDWIVATRK